MRTGVDVISGSSIIKFIIFYSLIINYCVSTFQLPTALFYINDVANLMLGIIVLKAGGSRRMSIPKELQLMMALLLLHSFAGFLLNGTSPILYIWGLRNNYRFLIFFIACVMVLTMKDLHRITELLIKLLPINVILCTIQYVRLSRSKDARIQQFLGDYIGGIFGTAQGCNRLMNVYLLFIFALFCSRYLKKEISGRRFLLILGVCLYIAIIEELKIAYFEFILVGLVLISLIARGANKIVYVLLGTCVAIFAINIWSQFDSNAVRILSSITTLTEYSSASSYGVNSLNRLTVIPYMRDLLFEDDIIKLLFGIGLGNADSSSQAFLTSELYKTYGHLRYTFFMHGLLFVETGVIGLVMYCAFYLIGFWKNVKYVLRKAVPSVDALFYAGTASYLVALISIFYNTTLRNELSAYLAFLFMAIPFILKKEMNSNKLLVSKS